MKKLFFLLTALVSTVTSQQLIGMQPPSLAELSLRSLLSTIHTPEDAQRFLETTPAHILEVIKQYPAVLECTLGAAAGNALVPLLVKEKLHNSLKPRLHSGNNPALHTSHKQLLTGTKAYLAFLAGQPKDLKAVACMPSRNQFIHLFDDGTLVLDTIGAINRERILDTKTAFFASNNSCDHFVSASHAGQLCIWKLPEAHMLKTAPCSEYAAGEALAISNDGACVLASTTQSPRTMIIWDLETNRTSTIQLSRGPITALAISGDKTRCVAATAHHFFVWDLVSRQQLYDIPGHTSFNSITNSLAMNADGSHAVSVQWPTSTLAMPLPSINTLEKIVCALECVSLIKKLRYSSQSAREKRVLEKKIDALRVKIKI